MLVGIDGKCLVAPRAGVARYLDGLLGGIERLGDSRIDVRVLKPPRRVGTLRWVMWEMQRATAQGFAVCHFPFYYLPLAPRCRTTVAIHDLLAIEHPEFFRHGRVSPIRHLLPRSVRMAAAIVTGSRCVGESIHERWGVPSDRIRIIPYGIERELFRAQPEPRVRDVRLKYGLERPYALQVGAIDPRRGADLSLIALREARKSHPDLELVFAGPARHSVAALDTPPAWTHLLGYVEDSDLPALMTGAAAVLAPSRGEGFDLPVLEALACGAPVVASDIDVHVEHFEPAVELFESGVADSMAAALVRVLEDSERAAELRTAGPALAGRFTWEACARAHMEMWLQIGSS